MTVSGHFGPSSGLLELFSQQDDELEVTTMDRLTTAHVQDIFTMHGPVTFAGDVPATLIGPGHRTNRDDAAPRLLPDISRAAEGRCAP
jgi:hypothetical protein